jgi:hypothetical protein
VHLKRRTRLPYNRQTAEKNQTGNDSVKNTVFCDTECCIISFMDDLSHAHLPSASLPAGMMKKNRPVFVL